ncbi:hypothetical protein DFQ27_002330 [Actinomortierella ambigua]|uniref:Secreted protein n=1 Tax=Actinomortierella ambigua TaxID=1343610 RepID=A0A9P6Q7Q8_9FUNG|nr:hypothetical protein DFQ26_004456 [Actinomortierella ambigua]KAG0262466.1 hypothetical protein DFQ27_002330 [Actinomortierella ambigua]
MIFSTLSKASLALIAASILLILTTPTEAHSWADCVDWRFKNPKNKSWNDSNGACFGYARRFPVKAKPFADYDEDWPNRHYEQSHKSPSPDYAPACSDGKSGETDGADERMAKPWTAAYNGRDFRKRRTGAFTTKKIGDTMCIRWPAKNHAVPKERDLSEVFVSFSKPNPKKDPTQKQFLSNIVARLNYKNCTTGGSTDRWPCGGCFPISKKKFTPGHYVGQWRWRLNDNEWYTSCFDVLVKK